MSNAISISILTNMGTDALVEVHRDDGNTSGYAINRMGKTMDLVLKWLSRRTCTITYEQHGNVSETIFFIADYTQREW